MTPIRLKESLLLKCAEWISLRKEHIMRNISNIENALFEESKGTSGDKHHTGRAMLQIDRENAGKQLQEIEKVVALFSKITFLESATNIRLGSLVETSNGTYFISISAGVIQFKNKDFYCISPGSPIAQLLLGKKQGEVIHFNSKALKIHAVY